MSELDKDAALVLFSGGQDSTTCLAWALNTFTNVSTIGFDYGQRHSIELEQRKVVRSRLADLMPLFARRLHTDHVLKIAPFVGPGVSALTDTGMAITAPDNALPSTFVPGRNLIFLTYAAALAVTHGIKNIVTGVCETDYSGYPDCRDDTISAMQVALNLGMESRLVIHTPLMWLTKAHTWTLAEQMGGAELVDLIIDHTHTCYRGDRSQKWSWGAGCGECPACQIRRAGYEEYRSELWVA